MTDHARHPAAIRSGPPAGRPRLDRTSLVVSAGSPDHTGRRTLAALVSALRVAVTTGSDWDATAGMVAAALERHLPGTDVLTSDQLAGSADGYRSHPLHVERDASFSVVALVWRPGQRTRIHDHVTWCAFGVIQGIEHEELFDANLTRLGDNINAVGDVSAFAPPGDRVRNSGAGVAVSIHVYGTDVTRIGSSVRRFYD